MRDIPYALRRVHDRPGSTIPTALAVTIALLVVGMPLQQALAATSSGPPLAAPTGGGMAATPRTLPADSTDSSGTLTGVLIGKDDGQSIPYGTVLLVETGVERFTDASGSFRIAGLTPGTYTVRARQIGYAPTDTTVRIDSAPAVTTVSIRLTQLPVILGAVRVRGHRSNKCVAAGIPDSTVDSNLATIFTQVRENVDRFRLLMEQYPFRYSREEEHFTRYDPGGDPRDARVSVDTTTFESRARRPYHIGGILYTDSDRAGQRRLYMYLPTFGELADPAFLAAHCFSYGGTASDHAAAGSNLIRVDFAPLSKIKQPDVSGSIYLDAQRLTVRRAVFEMTKPDAVHPPVIGFKVTTTFREFVPLVPLIDSVETEQPLPGEVYVRFAPKGSSPGSDVGGTSNNGFGESKRVTREALNRYRLLSIDFEQPSRGAGSSTPGTLTPDSTNACGQGSPDGIPTTQPCPAKPRS
jgi:hypothetical protein